MTTTQIHPPNQLKFVIDNAANFSKSRFSSVSKLGVMSIVLMLIGGLSLFVKLEFDRPMFDNYPPLPKIVLIGDSITQFSHDPSLMGFGACLQNEYVRNFDIINRGYSGWNTEGVGGILDSIINEFNNVAVFTLFLGANDAVLEGGAHVSLEKYRFNLVEMSKKIIAKSKLILITPPPVDGQIWKDRKNEVSMTYRDACISVATELGIPVLDLYQLFLGPDLTPEKWKLNKYLVDGLHLNSEGNKSLFLELKKIINGIL